MEAVMDTETLAWTAFRLNGSIDAYLLHLYLDNDLAGADTNNGKNKGIDNKAIRLR